MSNSEQQVVSMYELSAMSANDIAEALGYDLLAIKTTLANHSRQYREKMNSLDIMVAPNGQVVQRTDESDITDFEMGLLKNGLMDIALNAPEEQLNTKFRALKFLFNEKKGRNNVSKVSGLNVNIQVINQGVQQAREAMRRALEVKSEVVEA